MTSVKIRRGGSNILKKDGGKDRTLMNKYDLMKEKNGEWLS
jgi:hypothetical protein